MNQPISENPPANVRLAIVAGVAVGVVILLQIVATPKVAFYIDAIAESGLVYAIPVIAVAGLVAVIEYPRLALYLLAFLLPFNFVGGFWGAEPVILAAKIAVNVLSVAALLATLLAPPEDRAWITRTRLGQATLAWLGVIVMGTVVGFYSVPNRDYWLRESGWMMLFASALPFGTLLRGRRDIERILWTTCAGVAVLQTYGYWVLVTGRRYTRPDAWEGGQSFFRAPYSPESLFVLYLAAAALLYRADLRLFSRWPLALLATITLLGGGLLASMVRSLWLSAVVGMGMLLMLVPWTVRTAKMALIVVGSAVLAVAVVATVDSFSEESSGNWTSSAFTFLLDLGSKDSTSKITREIEWGNAIDVWKRSPVVGFGFGHAFPQITYGKVAESQLADAFYMHNSYLNVLAKCGAVGLAALLYLIWRTLAVAFHLLHRKNADVNQRIFAAAVAAAIVQVAALSATAPVLTVGDTAAYFGLMVGLVSVAWRAAGRDAA